ncbi:MAG: cardiolipin synthase [Saprospiraceae bacterium]
MNWVLVSEVIYIAIIILVCLRIIYDTSNTAKTLAYLISVIAFPIVGILIYFAFGVNYRKRKMYNNKVIVDTAFRKIMQKRLVKQTEEKIKENAENRELAYMLLNDTMSPLTSENHVKLLMNGENKFPEVLQALKAAKDHIHVQYYIYEDDKIGGEIEEVLIQKVKEGVTVRFMYDDFGSHSIGKKLVHRLKKGGVLVFPFLKIHFILFANRINYRNHRKIIVIDGYTSFVGGINVSDRYINSKEEKKKLYWRDAHLRIDGSGVQYLQYLFICDWNFCAGDKLKPNETFFPDLRDLPKPGKKLVQIAASGPDSETPTILYSILQAINLASKEVLITSPYFIPGESLMDALIIAALGGVSVKLLIPAVGDSRIVDMAARSYYGDLLKAGVEIYLYTKGFNHAKTLVADTNIAMVGTANMDFRSFDLNFEVNAIVYDKAFAAELRDVFYEDIKHSKKINPTNWNDRPLYKQMVEKTVRLGSSLL